MLFYLCHKLDTWLLRYHLYLYFIAFKKLLILYLTLMHPLYVLFNFQFTLLCVLIVSLYCDMHIYMSYGSLVNPFRHYLLYFHNFVLMWYETPPYCDIHPIEINKIIKYNFLMVFPPKTIIYR